MNKENIVSKMKDLIQFLNYHQALYDAGKPEIADIIWDAAYFELEKLEKEYPELIQSNSPTQKIEYKVMTKLNKVKHEYQPMLSLDKTKNIEDIKDFIGNKDWIAMLKLDGLTCRLTYEEGKLIRAETRGNGYEGEDITHNARVLPSIPQHIDYLPKLVIDGEVISRRVDFNEFAEKYANARNFAAGSIRLLDSAECAKRNLTFVAWDIIEGRDPLIKPALSEELCWLYRRGFQVTSFHTNEDYTLDTVIDGLVEENAHYDALCYPIDGIVFKWDNIKEYEAAGRTEHHFRGGMAYKFYDETYQTKLTGIEFTMGRNGVLTPVAQYENVEIDGTICNRASLHNLTIMKEILGETPYIGQEIYVIKSNQIIPQVQGAIKWDWLVNPVIEEILIPKNCPFCGQPLSRVTEIETEVLMCQNEACDGRLINRLDHFCSKKGLDIKGLSKATLEKLVDWGWINELVDLYHLNERRADWINKPGFGEKSVDNILLAIENSRLVTLVSFISAIGIPHIGNTLSKEICKYIDSYEDFREKVNDKWNFTIIDGIAIEKQCAILSFDYTEADKVALEMKAWTTSNSMTQDYTLADMTIVITGKLSHFKNRDDFVAIINQYAGKVVNSVSKNTNILINNDIDSNSSKNRAAKELGIPILTEEKFLSEYLHI